MCGGWGTDYAKGRCNVIVRQETHTVDLKIESKMKEFVLRGKKSCRPLTHSVVYSGSNLKRVQIE